jgi:hypothetical protein
LTLLSKSCVTVWIGVQPRTFLTFSAMSTSASSPGPIRPPTSISAVRPLTVIPDLAAARKVSPRQRAVSDQKRAGRMAARRLHRHECHAWMGYRVRHGDHL